MSHAFVTADTRPQRTRIQRGAIDLLAGLKRPVGYLVDVIPWGAVVRNDRDEEGVAMLVDAIGGRTPSIAVALGDRVFENLGIGGVGGRAEIELLVYFASSNARNQQIGRQEIDSTGTASDTADPGLHVMMEHALELLIGQYPGGAARTASKQLRIDREEELATTPAITLWLQTYKVTTATKVNEWRNATQLLTAIGMTGVSGDVLPQDRIDVVIELQGT